jgi:predicted GNAT family N-acyltransferase
VASDVPFTVAIAAWPDHAAQLRAVREAVFVREQGVAAALEWDGADPACTHALARAAGAEPVGTARMRADGHVGRMAVLAGWRGRGVGSALLGLLVDAARARGLPAVYLNAQLGAVAFYVRHGFAATGPVFLEAGIPHRRMVLPLAAPAEGPVL